MTRVYPPLNPFPRQGTTSLEGELVESEAGGLDQPTLRLDPLNSLTRLARGYLERYSDAKKRQGEIAALWGAHGAGKSHAIRFVIEQVEEKGKSHAGAAPRPFQVYAKAEGPDFVALYRTMMGRVPFELLRDLSLRFLGVVASDQFGREVDREVASQAAERVRRDPDQVYSLFRRFLVEEGAVQAQQSREIKQIAGGMDDFQRALSYLLSPELGAAANAWLAARPVSEDDRRKLGVTGPISSPEVAKLGIQLLATLFRRIGRPFLLYIDQYEKLVIAGEAVLARQNTGLLHSLVEIVPRENGMLVLSGSEEAWQALPPDLKQRFAGNGLYFPILSLRESTELLSVYIEFSLNASGEPCALSPSEEDLYPFTAAAVREIVRNSGGNVRRILQISAAVFDAAKPKKETIDKELVLRALSEKGWEACNQAAVVTAIERCLSGMSLRFERDRRIDDLRVDFAIVDTAGVILAVIELSEALFQNDEAKKALRTIRLVEELRRVAKSPHVVLVVLGYVSPEVSAEVKVAVNALIVYDPVTFRAIFTATVERLLRSSPEPAADKEEEQALRAQVAEVRTTLEKVLVSRESDVQRLEARLAELLERQAVDRVAERRENARHAWLDERQRIEERIRTVREQRRLHELEELSQLRAKAELERQRRAVFGAVGVGVSLYALLTLLWVQLFMWLSSLVIALVLCFGLSTVGAVGFYFLFVWRVLERRELRELAGNVGSLQELDRLASGFISSRPVSARLLLYSNNPHLRYAGVLLSSRMGHCGDAVKLLQRERSAIIRRKIMKCATGAGEVRLGDVVELPELPYAVEGLAASVSPESFMGLPSRMKTLGVLSGARSMDGESLVAAMERRRPNVAPLWKALEDGITDELAPALEKVAESALRAELEELSPFENGGLGTNDELQHIRPIDEYFLFFRQLLFFQERRAF
jgi:ABC-type multidrug transport system fused ATPase/permease subunit